jgi:hypothetical protein
VNAVAFHRVDLGPIRLTIDLWPIAVFELPERGVSDAAQHAYFACMESMMTESIKKREKVFIVTDFTLLRELPSATQRKYSSDWMKRGALLCRAGSLGTAHVTPSAILRGIITAVLWVQPPPTASFCVRTRREGILKGIELLEAEKRIVPPRLQAFRDSPAL